MKDSLLSDDLRLQIIRDNVLKAMLDGEYRHHTIICFPAFNVVKPIHLLEWGLLPNGQHDWIAH